VLDNVAVGMGGFFFFANRRWCRIPAPQHNCLTARSGVTVTGSPFFSPPSLHRSLISPCAVFLDDGGLAAPDASSAMRISFDQLTSREGLGDETQQRSTALRATLCCNQLDLAGPTLYQWDSPCD
jgi:hypothetical protein